MNKEKLINEFIDKLKEMLKDDRIYTIKIKGETRQGMSVNALNISNYWEKEFHNKLSKSDIR